MDPTDYPFKVVTKSQFLRVLSTLKSHSVHVQCSAHSSIWWDLLLNFIPSPTPFFHGGQLLFAAARFQPGQQGLAATTSQIHPSHPSVSPSGVMGCHLGAAGFPSVASVPPSVPWWLCDTSSSSGSRFLMEEKQLCGLQAGHRGCPHWQEDSGDSARTSSKELGQVADLPNPAVLEMSPPGQVWQS